MAFSTSSVGSIYIFLLELYYWLPTPKYLGDGAAYAALLAAPLMWDVALLLFPAILCFFCPYEKLYFYGYRFLLPKIYLIISF
jgi:hypothetical protein